MTVGAVIGVIGGLVIGALGHVAFGLLVVGLVLAATFANWSIARRSERRLADPAGRTDNPTGKTLVPPTVWAGGPDGSTPCRWTGAADVLGGLGRINFSAPLGVLELAGRSLSLGVRPRFMAWQMGCATLVVEPEQVEAVYPSRARLRYRAIAIRPIARPPSYFLTLGSSRESILATLAAAGFPVLWEERTYSFA